MSDDDLPVNVKLIFGSIEIQNLPPRIVGSTIYPRYRTITRDGFGGIEVSEPQETGCGITDALEYLYMFGPREMPPDPR